jgi:hypothetical protein
MPHKPHSLDLASQDAPRQVGYLCLLGWTEIRFVEGEATDHVERRLGLAEAMHPHRPADELGLAKPEPWTLLTDYVRHGCLPYCRMSGSVEGLRVIVISTPTS